MLKILQRIENCIHNAFEKVKYEHAIDADLVTFIHVESDGILVRWFMLGRCANCATFLIKNARVYQDVYAYAYKTFTDIVRPYFKNDTL